MIYRPLAAHDLETIYALGKEHFASTQEFSWDWSLEELQDYLTPAGIGIIAAEQEDILGFTLAKTSYSSQRPDVAWLTYILVKEDQQGKGIAGTLLQKIEQTLKDLGKKHLITDVYAENTSSLAFFGKQDFDKKETWHILSKPL